MAGLWFDELEVGQRFDLHRAYNQHGTLVASCRRSGLQRRKPA